MRKYFDSAKTLENCKIFRMLEENGDKPHLSFHTPGHKVNGFDITELSYSDNLSCPHGCIAEAEKDIARILGAAKSFLLTDGSTSGVLSLLQAARSVGVKTVLVPLHSHKSVFNGCAMLGINAVVLPQTLKNKIPQPLCVKELEEGMRDLFCAADAVLVTSPDYYGNIQPLQELSALCKKTGKLLLVDGAHGGHLHFQKQLYAGTYADMWVDGVHKSLPALTQGAVVSARTEALAEHLGRAVDIFRTSSPSYPIMASVEYAVKYPRNEGLEKEVEAFKRQTDRLLPNDDWTKLCALFGENAFQAEKELEEKGIFAEFCDGNVLCFYLSPATSKEAFSVLRTELSRLFERYPYVPENTVERVPAPRLFEDKACEWVPLSESVGRVCAGLCGLFPPCTPLLCVGERVSEEKLGLLKNADNVFGLFEGKILVEK